jgi:hypothetical protein
LKPIITAFQHVFAHLYSTYTANINQILIDGAFFQRGDTVNLVLSIQQSSWIQQVLRGKKRLILKVGSLTRLPAGKRIQAAVNTKASGLLEGIHTHSHTHTHTHTHTFTHTQSYIVTNYSVISYCKKNNLFYQSTCHPLT